MLEPLSGGLRCLLSDIDVGSKRLNGVEFFFFNAAMQHCNSADGDGSLRTEMWTPASFLAYSKHKESPVRSADRLRSKPRILPLDRLQVARKETAAKIFR